MITPALFCRFCLSETSCPQEDNYPNGLCIKVNGKLFPLPVRPWISSPSHPHLTWTVLNQHLFLQGYVPPAKNGLEQKRPGRPLNITSLVRLSSAVPNHISVTWSPEIGKVREGNVNIPVELMKANCGALVWFPLTRFTSSFRPTPCLCTWWGSWRPRSSCRGWRWRASGTQITPERWVIPHFTACSSVQFTSS